MLKGVGVNRLEDGCGVEPARGTHGPMRLSAQSFPVRLGTRAGATLRVRHACKRMLFGRKKTSGTRTPSTTLIGTVAPLLAGMGFRYSLRHHSQGFPPRGKTVRGDSVLSGIITATLPLEPQFQHESKPIGLVSPHCWHFHVSACSSVVFSFADSLDAVKTRCRITRYQMKPKPHKNKATTTNTTNGPNEIPSTREPLDFNLAQSIAAHSAVSKPNRKLAPTVDRLTSSKLTANHTTAGTTTCGGQPLLAFELVVSRMHDGEPTNSSGC